VCRFLLWLSLQPSLLTPIHTLGKLSVSCFTALYFQLDTEMWHSGCQLMSRSVHKKLTLETHTDFFKKVSKLYCTGFLQVLEIYWNSKTLLEILEISLNLYGPPGNCCITYRWSTALVSNHNKTGYRIAYLRNWSPFLSLPRPYVVHIMFLFYIYRQTIRFGTLRSIPKQRKHVLDFSWNPSWNLLEISWKFVQLNL